MCHIAVGFKFVPALFRSLLSGIFFLFDISFSNVILKFKKKIYVYFCVSVLCVCHMCARPEEGVIFPETVVIA